MKSKSGFAWKLGAFVTVGFLLLIGAIYFIGSQQNLFGSTFRLRTVFSSVSGLQSGNNVRFSGINVGTVDNVQILNDTSVLVGLVIEKKVQPFIKKDAHATIGSEGLMGDKIVAINPGSMENTPVNDNDLIISDSPTEMSDIINSLKITSDNAAIITGQLAEITYKINNGEGAIGKLLTDTSVGSDLTTTITNLKESTKNLNQNMEAAKSNFLLRGYFKKKEKEKEKQLEKQKENAEKEKEDKK